MTKNWFLHIAAFIAGFLVVLGLAGAGEAYGRMSAESELYRHSTQSVGVPLSRFQVLESGQVSYFRFDVICDTKTGEEITIFVFSGSTDTTAIHMEQRCK